MRDWRGKTYWLIGASEGLGRALAQQMSRVGANLILTARDAARLEELKSELPGLSQVHAADVTDAAAFRAVADTIGPVDGMVYLAGICRWTAPGNWNDQDAEDMAAVNFTGALRAVGAVLPGMVARGTGHIVLTGSLAAYRGVPQMGVYGATKAGLLNLAESLQTDLRGTDVDVQIVNPGFIRTRMTESNTGRMPYIMDPATAAREMFEAMNSDANKRAFPAPLALATRLGQFAPDWLWSRLIGRLG